MRLALRQAERAALAGEAPIGCVIADGVSGEIIAQACNRPIALNDPTGHAEILALRQAGEALGNYRLRAGLTLYVTLEPCTMCAGAISQARLARVVYGARDEKGGAVESGVRFFESPSCNWRPQVTSGVGANESALLLRTFFRARRA